MANHCKFFLIVLINTQYFLVIQILDLEKEEKCFFVIQIPVTKVIGKTAIWTNFCFWVSPPNYTNWAFMFLMQQSDVQWRVLWNLLCNAVVLFYLKKIWKIKILPHLPRYLSCLFGLQKLLRLISWWRNG